MPEEFDVGFGIRQGDAFSPALFTIAIEKVISCMEGISESEVFEDTTILARADGGIVIG